MGGAESKPTQDETLRELHRESQALLRYSRQLRFDSDRAREDEEAGARAPRRPAK